jgi:hypothetical protein
MMPDPMPQIIALEAQMTRIRADKARTYTEKQVLLHDLQLQLDAQWRRRRAYLAAIRDARGSV